MNRRFNNRNYDNNDQRQNNRFQNPNNKQQRPTNNQRRRQNNNNNNQQQRPTNNQRRRHNNNNNQQQNNNQSQHQLNTEWTVYIHDTHDRDWSLESYKMVFTIKTIEDFWTFFNNVHNYQRFQFFIMRNKIKPTYEEPENKNGGSYSYMVQGRDVNETLVHVVAKMIGEQLVNPESFGEIKGISLVPKKGISILKIWLKNKNNPLELDTYDIQGLRNGRFQPHKF